VRDRPAPRPEHPYDSAHWQAYDLPEIAAQSLQTALQAQSAQVQLAHRSLQLPQEQVLHSS